MNDATTVRIDAADAIEIAEALHWLADWLASDPAFEASIGRFSHGLTSLDETITDLDRLAALLGWPR